MSRPRACDHDVVLDLWAAGFLRKSIAADIDSAESTVHTIVSRARQRGDQRAKRRYGVPIPRRQERRAGR